MGVICLFLIHNGNLVVEVSYTIPQIFVMQNKRYQTYKYKVTYFKSEHNNLKKISIHK
jgi:hypothetical protein